MQRTNGLAIAIAAALAAGCSSQNPQRETAPPVARRDAGGVGTSGTADLTSQDARDFLAHLATVDQSEIQLGKLAVSRGTSPGVRKFGQMMIDDHTSSSDRLESLERDLKIEPPKQPQQQDSDQHEELAKQSGSEFDREYASAMVRRHEDLIDQLEPRIDKKGLDQWKEEMKGKTKIPAGAAVLPDKSDNKTTMRINQFAASIYPTVYSHLQAAKALEQSLEARGRRSE
jgi:putative membrane protein